MVSGGRGRALPSNPCSPESGTAPPADWRAPPFSATVSGGRLTGRGAVDMKGAIAAFVAAVAELGPMPGSIALLITGDEEGPAINGARRMLERLAARGERLDACIVGEPTNPARFGDAIKIGRRGSINGLLRVKGRQGHVAYPEQSVNPIHEALPALQRLVAEPWDRGNSSFPPTRLQISNINAGTGADNVIPGTLEVQFNLRYSTELDSAQIRSRVAQLLAEAGFEHELRWRESGRPFLAKSTVFSGLLSDCIEQELGLRPELATTGGTSDGRFIAPTGAEVVEFGPCNESIHRVNENVGLAELDSLTRVYRLVLERFDRGRYTS